LFEFSQAVKALGRGVFLVLAFVLLQSVACPEIEYVGTLKREKVDKFPTYEEVFCRMVKELGKGKKLKFTSLYRSVKDQENACASIKGCGRCCPGQCACPGRSNHQHHATADVGGIPGDVRAGCDFLLKVCNEIKACGKNVGCEIGGYGAGAHHLAADEGVKNTAYNQCAHLKSQVASGGKGECKNKGGKKEPPNQQPPQQQEPSSPSPPNPDPAQQMQQANQLMKAIMNPEQGRNTQARSQPYADNYRGATSPTPESKNPGTSRQTGGDGAPGKIGNGIPNPISDITRGAVGGLESYGADNEVTGGRGASRGSAGRELSNGSNNFAGENGSGTADSSGGGRSGTSIIGGSSERKEANELLATFGGGNKYLGGAKNPNAMGGLETDAAVKNTLNEFEKMVERDPASSGATDGNAQADEFGSANGESLFARCHSAYVRSLMSGKITPK